MSKMSPEEMKNYGIDPEIKEMKDPQGFDRPWQIGDRITVVEDNEMEGYFEGEEGEVVGFGRIEGVSSGHPDYEIRARFGTTEGREYMMVLFEGSDEPREVNPVSIERVV